MNTITGRETGLERLTMGFKTRPVQLILHTTFRPLGAPKYKLTTRGILQRCHEAYTMLGGNAVGPVLEYTSRGQVPVFTVPTLQG